MNVLNPYDGSIRLYHGASFFNPISVTLNDSIVFNGLPYNQISPCLPIQKGNYHIKIIDSYSGSIVYSEMITIDGMKFLALNKNDHMNQIKISLYDDYALNDYRDNEENVVGKNVKKVVNQFNQVVEVVVSKTGEIIKDVKDQTGKIIISAGDKIKKIIDQLGNVIEVVVNKVGTIIAVVISETGNIIVGATNKIGKSIKKVINQFGHIVNVVVDEVENVVAFVVDEISDLFKIGQKPVEPSPIT